MATAFESKNKLSSHEQLVADIVSEIDNCMDALKAQLNKNPNSRLDDHSNRNQDNKRRKKNNYNNNNNKEQEEEHKSSSSDSYNNNNNNNNNRKKKSRNKRGSKSLDPNIYMSKRLSFYLRHGAEKAGLKIRNDGYVKVLDILKLNEFKQNNANFDKIKNIVDTNDKKRFNMIEENKIWYIRANQGHSIKSIQSKDLLKEITEKDIDKYPVVCHGTYLKVWDIVKTEGLKRMSRNHIHFVPSDSVKGKGVISGMRYNCQILIYIDIAKAINDGIHFFLSDNNVILSPGINGRLPPKYFTKVTTFDKGQSGKIIWSIDDKQDNDDI